MKKLLALLLALVMILAVTMVSCSKDKEENKDDGGNSLDDAFDAPSENQSDDDKGSDGTDQSSDNSTDSTEKGTEASDFTATSGTAYILHPVKVREKAKIASKTSVGETKWADAVERIETNGTWTKIRFKDAKSGATKEGYVLDEILTSEKKQVTLVMLETPVAATINGLGTNPESGKPITVNIRTTPWNCSKSEEYPNVNVLPNILNEEYDVKDGDAVEKLGATEDGEWILIKFVKAVDAEEVEEIGFCHKDFVKVAGEEPETPVTPDKAPIINPDPII